MTHVQGEFSFMIRCFRELRRKFLALPLAGLLCCGTVAQQNQPSAMVTTSHTPGVNFSRYHTYKWVESARQHPDPSVDAQLKELIDSQLASKGLTKADAAADLNVSYQTAVSRTETWEVYEDWTQTGLMDQHVPQHKKIIVDAGTLVIDIYDTAAKSLVWTGRATQILDPDVSREDRQKNLDNAATKLLADFPPN